MAINGDYLQSNIKFLQMLNINNLSSIKEKQANLESARKVAQMQVLADRHNPESRVDRQTDGQLLF